MEYLHSASVFCHKTVCDSMERNSSLMDRVTSVLQKVDDLRTLEETGQGTFREVYQAGEAFY